MIPYLDAGFLITLLIKTPVLGKLLADLKPPQGELLADFFLHGLSYDEMAKKHGLAIGSVGVYLKRGLEAIRRAWERKGER